MKHPAIYILLATLAATSAAAAATASPAKKPTTTVEPDGCVTPACHANVKKHKVVHGPVAVNGCDSCHRLTDPRTHTFAHDRKNAAMCTYCHEFNLARKPVVHAPAARGECLGCHDPHGGERKSLLREASTGKLCGRCHETIARGRKFMHSPAQQGECDSCHTPHASNYPKLLDAVGTDLCLTCHADFDKRMAKAPYRHKAIEQGCTSCHDAHGAAYPMAVRKPTRDLCLSCHPKIKARIDRSQDKHSVVMSETACLTCHTPHGGNLARGLKDLPARICMTCHAEKATGPTGRTVAAVPEISDPKLYKHGPIREGQCGGCHSVHGAEHGQLLEENYSATFYQQSASDNYRLCLKCHDLRLVQDPKGPTGFRNGDHNLHYVHVLKDNREHNCRACHISHAAGNAPLVREWVQYGKWKMPVAFRQTLTGGTCTPGCHVPWAYDRVTPVAAATRPASGPGTTARLAAAGMPAARTPRDEPVAVAWTARDALGALVSVPDPKRPTLLLFVGPLNPQARLMLQQAAAALASEAPAAHQTLVILAGPDAPAQARDLATAGTVPWPIVPDAKGVLATASNVHGWPMTLIVRPDGLQVARVGGAPGSLAVRLRAYLDLASGNTARPASQTQPAAPEPIVDRPNPARPWQLLAANQYLDDNQPALAHKLLTEALQSQPDSVALRAALVRALTQLNRAPEALELLSSLPASALPADQSNLLRAKALLASNQPAPAKAALLAALQSNPSLPEAHFLLGQLYEREKDFPRAAQSYRAATGRP